MSGKKPEGGVAGGYAKRLAIGQAEGEQIIDLPPEARRQPQAAAGAYRLESAAAGRKKIREICVKLIWNWYYMRIVCRWRRAKS